jgi:hypothetical protein
MNKLLYLLLLFASITFGQNIDFSNNQNFRNKILASTAYVNSDNPGNGIARGMDGNSIDVDADNNNEISFTEALAVWHLDVPSSGLSNLYGIEFFANLRSFFCNNNNGITVLHLEALVNLQTFNCNNCSLVSLTFVPNSGLQVLNCSNNDLITLNITGFTSLSTLDCSNNSLLNIDFTGCALLQNITCSHNELITIDVSDQIYLLDLDCSNNNLVTMFVKNGRNETLAFNGGNNNVLYICADDSQIPAILSQLSSNPNCVVNSFCTDTPGGNYNTLKGTVSFNSQAPKSFIKLKCFIGSNVLQTTTNADGDYAFYTTENGVFTVALASENTVAYTSTSGLSQTGNFGNNNNSIIIKDFNVSDALVYNDVEMVIAPTFPVMGQNTYLVVVKNKGNQTATGTMKINSNQLATLVVPPAIDLPAGVTFANYQQTTGISDWGYANLQPFETKVFKISFTVPNSSTPVNISTEIITNNDINFGDNTFVPVSINADMITNSNTIQCLEGTSLDALTMVGQYLHYMINIQNDGDGIADTIVIENTFDPLKYDIDSLQLLGSDIDSDYTVKPPVQLDVKGNKATYSFRKAGNGGPGGHGGVLLKIKTKSDLPDGSSVINNVIVNFEYDAPINVNGTATTFANLKVAENQLDKSITIYPNPAISVVTVNGANAIQMVQVYDVQGRLLQTNIGNATNYVIDIADKSNGIYFFKVTSDKGMKVERVVKE